MSRDLNRRVAKLEAVAPPASGPSWWAVQKWLGHPLTPEQEAAVAALPRYDPSAPVDMSGWSPEAVRQWGGGVAVS